MLFVQASKRFLNRFLFFSVHVLLQTCVRQTLIIQSLKATRWVQSDVQFDNGFVGGTGGGYWRELDCFNNFLHLCMRIHWFFFFFLSLHAATLCPPQTPGGTGLESEDRWEYKEVGFQVEQRKQSQKKMLRARWDFSLFCRGSDVQYMFLNSLCLVITIFNLYELWLFTPQNPLKSVKSKH